MHEILKEFQVKERLGSGTEPKYERNVSSMDIDIITWTDIKHVI